MVLKKLRSSLQKKKMWSISLQISLALILTLTGFDTSFAKDTGQIKISCVGNSNTDGWPGKRDYVPYTKTLQELLGKKFQVQNFGRTGATVLKAGEYPYWTFPQFKDAMQSEPDLVTIVLGTNDAKDGEWKRGGPENFQKDLETMIDTFKQLPSKPQVIVCTPFHMLKGSFGMSIATMENEIIPAIKNAAAAKNVTLIDLYELTDDPAYFDKDGVHVNDTGHKFFAQVFNDFILENIKTRKTSNSK